MVPIRRVVSVRGLSEHVFVVDLSEDHFRRVKRLATTGFSDYWIAERTGIPRSTVQRWRRRSDAPRTARRPASAENWRVIDPTGYCYLLGCYLGDGHIDHRPPNGWTLRIACDRQYNGVVDEIRAAMAATFPGARSTRRPKSEQASDVISVSHPAVGAAFPQHGRGPKHLRAIELAAWQVELTHAHPKALLRGLIHSDGCRTLNRFRTRLPGGRTAEYSYVRYFFSNQSADIRAVFADHCQLLGIRVTQSNQRNLSVSHRESVALLDTFVGPKS